MNYFERMFKGDTKMPPEQNHQGSDVEKITAIEKDVIADKLVRLANEPGNSVNEHLKKLNKTSEKDINEGNEKISDEAFKILLLTNLEDEDFYAFKKIFNEGWNEKSVQLKEYEQSVVDWEKKEKQTNGLSPKIEYRRSVSTAIRHYLINKAVEEALRQRDMKKTVNK